MENRIKALEERIEELEGKVAAATTTISSNKESFNLYINIQTKFHQPHLLEQFVMRLSDSHSRLNTLY